MGQKYNKYLENCNKIKRLETVEEMNKNAKETINDLKNLLKNAVKKNEMVNWKVFNKNDSFYIPPEDIFQNDDEYDYMQFNNEGCPVNVDLRQFESKPEYKEFRTKYSLFKKLFSSNKIKENYIKLEEEWQKKVNEDTDENNRRKALYDKTVELWQIKNTKFNKDKIQFNNFLIELKVRYEKKEPEAIEEYCQCVLNVFKKPDNKRNYIFEYKIENKILVVNYELPSPDQMPKIESYKYIKTKNEIITKDIKDIERKILYDNTIYQICIRTIYELFRTDYISEIKAVAFNGLVTNINSATGLEETKFIASISVGKEEFQTFDLTNVDAKATFKHLKGVSAATFVDLVPIPLVIKMDKTDKRFIEGRAVISGLDEHINLAAMHWDDFEHLICEIFTKIFSSKDGEVRVTQSSSDGGVDAIAFDPDLITGGKIIIQAKRYTNTVGVSAVRDLWGTVGHEGASKGILVTTSDFGRDSHEFVKDKPITLINGNNLLSLLQEHGYNAHINVAEAKKILGLEGKK